VAELLVPAIAAMLRAPYRDPAGATAPLRAARALLDRVEYARALAPRLAVPLCAALAEADLGPRAAGDAVPSGCAAAGGAGAGAAPATGGKDRRRERAHFAAATLRELGCAEVWAALHTHLTGLWAGAGDGGGGADAAEGERLLAIFLRGATEDNGGGTFWDAGGSVLGGAVCDVLGMLTARMTVAAGPAALARAGAVLAVLRPYLAHARAGPHGLEAAAAARALLGAVVDVAGACPVMVQTACSENGAEKPEAGPPHGEAGPSSWAAGAESAIRGAAAALCALRCGAGAAGAGAKTTNCGKAPPPAGELGGADAAAAEGAAEGAGGGGCDADGAWVEGLWRCCSAAHVGVSLTALVRPPPAGPDSPPPLRQHFADPA